MMELNFKVIYFTFVVFAKTYIVGTHFKAVITCTYNSCFVLKEEIIFFLFKRKLIFFTVIKIAL